MKTNIGLIAIKAIITILILLVAGKSLAQPDYVFTNGILQSGTDLEVGAKYRYTNIKPGVDGIITIKAMSNITLDELDGASGFAEAFQPYIYCPGKKKGYIEFTLDFVQHNTNTPQIMLEVPMTAIDIDGWEFPDEKIFEYDQFKLTPSYYVNYSTVGSQLNIQYIGGPSGWVSAENRTGIVYDGIDTVQRDVMFTIVYANVSSITFRVGADNKSNEDMQRLRSVYFKKFNYPNGLLASNQLIEFSGKATANKVNLRFSLSQPAAVKSVTVERAAGDMQFQPVQDAITISNSYNYTAEDHQLNGISFYRLKIVHVSGSVTYSNILRFETTSTDVFKVFPTMVQDQVTVQMKNVSESSATMQIFDFNGQMVRSQQVRLQNGIQNFTISNLSQLSSGNYLVVTKAGTQQFQQKIVIQ